MNCEDFKRCLHRYYLGRLDQESIDRLHAHQKDCADCDLFATIAKEISCKDFTELLNGYVEETWSAKRREIFDRHLSICSDCTAYLQSYRATMKMSAIAVKDAMRRLSDEMPDELIGVILAARAEEEKAGGR